MRLIGRFDRIQEYIFLMTIGWCLGLAELAKLLGLSLEIGAFIAGVTLASLLRSTKEVGLAGLETLTGVPAHVGGAVAMNAGTRDGETFDRLVSLTVLDRDGQLSVLGKPDFQPHCRDGGLGDHRAGRLGQAEEEAHRG